LTVGLVVLAARVAALASIVIGAAVAYALPAGADVSISHRR